MKERLLEFLRSENKSSAQLAEEIGVQPSGISHIISGRNNPSLDFVIKMLERYPYLSTEWLLFGKGLMYKDQHYGTLFDIPETNNTILKSSENAKSAAADTNQENSGTGDPDRREINTNSQTVNKIVFFFDDGSFEEYLNRK